MELSIPVGSRCDNSAGIETGSLEAAVDSSPALELEDISESSSKVRMQHYNRGSKNRGDIVSFIFPSFGTKCQAASVSAAALHCDAYAMAKCNQKAEKTGC